MVSIPHHAPPADLGGTGLVLGLDIGGTKLAAGVVDSSGGILSLVRVPTPNAQAGWRPGVDALFTLGRRAMESAGIEAAQLTGIGVASGGPLDPAAGLILGPPNLPAWDNVPVVQLAEAAFRRPAFLENDANAGALASHRWGTWAGEPNLVYMTISTGIGGGVLIDGRLLRGAAGNAGEIGHAVVDWDGRSCDCGQRGCLEAYVSGTSIARRATEALQTGRRSSLSEIPQVTAADVAAAAARADELATEIWHDTTAILGAAVTSMLNLFEPSVVILGGGVTQAGAMLIDPVRAMARSLALSPTARRAEVVITPHGDAIGVLGSAAAAIAQLQIGTASG